MKSVNNKINKPFISIGFDKNGKITFNVDLNKTNKLSPDNFYELNDVINNIKKVIIGKSVDNDVPPLQTLKIVEEFSIISGIIFPNVVNIDELVSVETSLRNKLKLQAIKTFKEAAGCGLKDSKEFVDWYDDALFRKYNISKNDEFFKSH